MNQKISDPGSAIPGCGCSVMSSGGLGEHPANVSQDQTPERNHGSVLLGMAV